LKPRWKGFRRLLLAQGAGQRVGDARRALEDVLAGQADPSAQDFRAIQEDDRHVLIDLHAVEGLDLRLARVGEKEPCAADAVIQIQWLDGRILGGQRAQSERQGNEGEKGHGHLWLGKGTSERTSGPGNDRGLMRARRGAKTIPLQERLPGSGRGRDPRCR